MISQCMVEDMAVLADSVGLLFPSLSSRETESGIYGRCMFDRRRVLFLSFPYSTGRPPSGLEIHNEERKGKKNRTTKKKRDFNSLFFLVTNLHVHSAAVVPFWSNDSGARKVFLPLQTGEMTANIFLYVHCE